MAINEKTEKIEKIEKTDKIDILQNEKLLVKENPLLLVEYEFLTIKTKDGQLIRLKLNTVQKKILAKIKSIMAKNRPVRLWILKARQSGVSTLSEGIVYAFTSQKEATNSLVIADDIDGSNYIFGMQRLFQEKIDEHLRPLPKHSNEKKLEFDKIHSQILIDTSDNLNAGRKYTFRAVHLSEVAFFRDLKTLMLGLNQSVPNLPGTIIIGETTANGIGNHFYDEWVKCSDDTIKTDWETLFIPWFDIEEYTLPGDLYPIDGINFATPTDKEKFLIEEKAIKNKYNLSKEQINWRRWCIINNCNGSVLQFNQEYPDSPETAFIATGDLFFDKEALKSQSIIKPFSIGNLVKEEGRYLLRYDNTGLFKFYHKPLFGEQYVVGADAAEGLEHGDKSAAVVLNKRTNRTCCVYNHNISPDRFAEDLVKLATYYNNSIIACENKGYGYSVNQDIYKKYGNVYRRIKSKKGFTEPTQELGWNTNSVTRPQMLSQLAEEILNGSTELLDNDLIKQCWTFINNVKTKKPEAEKGKCDDLVIARAIAGQVRIEKPFKQVFRRKKKKIYRGLSGY